MTYIRDMKSTKDRVLLLTLTRELLLAPVSRNCEHLFRTRQSSFDFDEITLSFRTKLKTTIRSRTWSDSCVSMNIGNRLSCDFVAWLFNDSFVGTPNLFASVLFCIPFSTDKSSNPWPNLVASDMQGGARDLFLSPRVNGSWHIVSSVNTYLFTRHAECCW